MNMLNVYLDTTPLKTGHATRGIGRYTQLLLDGLSEEKGLSLVESARAADLVHYPYFDLFFSTLPLRKPKPSVVTIHDVIPLVFPEAYKPGKKGKFNFFRQRLALGNVKAIITDSQTSAADITTHLHIKPHRIFVVPLAASPNLQSPPPKVIDSVRRKYGLPSKYLLYVGDINYNKNLPQLIKALKYLPWQVKLVLLGSQFKPQPIPEWQAIETQLALSDVEKRVQLLPSVESDNLQDLSAIYAGALCYVQPSLYEGFGLPVLEALQVGTPVVSSHTSSLPEVIGSAGLLVEPSAEAFANAIKQILTLTPKERLAMICSGKARARRFSQHKVAVQTLAVYRYALQTKS